MKQRIISGIVMILIVSAVLISTSFFPIVITLFLGALSSIAVYEMLYNTKNVTDKGVVVVSAIFAFLLKLCYTFESKLSEFLNGQSAILVLTVLFAVFLIIRAVVRNNTFSVKELCFSFTIPVFLGFAFNSIEYVYLDSGLKFYGLLMLLNFSCINDIGAYFIGSKFGKHKMSPVISPKKSWEGAIGGVVCSLIATAVIISFANGAKFDAVMIKWLIATPIYCIVGIFGDLIASVIKRNANIKDYSNIIPGHGGIMDRLDSILLIAPVMELLIKLLLK
jgi:phosphatidate cytidylyltransferase